MSDLEFTPNEPGGDLSPASELGAPGPSLLGTGESPASNVVSEPLIFTFEAPAPLPPARIPHLGHLALLSAFLLFGFLCATVLMLVAFFLHWGGVTTQDQIKTNAPYLLGFEAILYLVALVLGFFLFPLFWRKSFFSGIHWRGRTALRWSGRLALIALSCFGLALLVEVLLPGPEHAPIEDLFRSPGAAWTMFFFGITLAPFFEEIFFRGFVLPAFGTAFDWIVENFFDNSALQFDSDNRLKSSIPAIIVASVLIWIPFSVCFLTSHVIICLLILALWSISAFLVWAWVNFYSSKKKCSVVLDENGHPQWSIAAMIAASIPTSIFFARIHADQQGHSLGPFLLLVVVSLILCAVRLKLRSVAASTLVHSCYNLLIFSVMLIGTGGFRHFD